MDIDFLMKSGTFPEMIFPSQTDCILLQRNTLENNKNLKVFSKLDSFVSKFEVRPASVFGINALSSRVKFPTVSDPILIVLSYVDRLTEKEFINSVIDIFVYSMVVRLVFEHPFQQYILFSTQLNYILYDYTEWNFSMFIKLCLEQSVQNCIFALGYRPLICPLDSAIGSHSEFQGSLTNSIAPLTTNRHVLGAYQIFVGSPKTYFVPYIKSADISMTRFIIEKHRLKIYIHAPLVVNLGSENTKACQTIAQLLRLGDRFGAKGVVIHLGKGDKELCQRNLNLLYTTPTESCPLLLETPASPSRVTEFEIACSMMEQTLGKRGGVCADTCHIFASGIDPLEFIQSCGDVIRLIHFNDSQFDFGCGRDRHASPGQGKIPFTTLSSIATWGRVHNVPLIVE